MDFFDVVEARRSVRQFSDQPVAGNLLQRILECANRAPSAGNLQAYEIYVVREQARKDALARAALDQDFLAQAPVVLAFCSHAQRSQGRYGRRGVALYTIQDTTIACTFAMLAAAALGLATVWVGAFDDNAVREVLAAPKEIVPLALLPVGYAAEEPPVRARRDLNEIVHDLEIGKRSRQP